MIAARGLPRPGRPAEGRRTEYSKTRRELTPSPPDAPSLRNDDPSIRFHPIFETWSGSVVVRLDRPLGGMRSECAPDVRNRISQTMFQSKSDLEFCKSPATTVKIGEIDPFRPQIALAHLGHRSI